MYTKSDAATSDQRWAPSRSTVTLGNASYVAGCLAGLMCAFALSVNCQATPPEYVTFGRNQSATHSPSEDSLLRIWIVFVEQGDGILIQLPKRYNYDPDPSDSDSDRSEQVDILVDGGSSPPSEAWRISEFLRSIYGSESPIIECAVITHHDQDHVAGLTHLLTESDIEVRHVFHNGLASYVAGKPDRMGITPFPKTGKPTKPAVYDPKSRNVGRGLAYLYPDGHANAGLIDSAYLLKDLTELRKAYDAEELQGVYEELATAILEGADGNGLESFDRAYVGQPFINEKLALATGIEFKAIWPHEELRPYGNRDWGETINGNSVSFRLEYGDFSMVFTGDHNEKSEEVFLEQLQAAGDSDTLNCDVFKVPHHGSSHALQNFFKRDGFEPVVSVASMGDRGFKSKKMYTKNWEHPATSVIDWLGGPHRVYLTFAHEKKFRWPQITSEAKRRAMIERCHILVETDGEWFRITEVDADDGSSVSIPTISETRRGNGTRWIRAAEQP